MKSILPFAVALALAASPASAQQSDAHAGHHPAPAASNTADVPAEAGDAVDVVDRFGKALSTGDFATVEALLDPQVLILESGGAERDRAEYLAHHAGADFEFLKSAHQQPTHRRARIDGDLAWVASESELHATDDGKPMTLLSTETMVLRRDADGWRIVHIHWSSRRKP